ncbi:Lipoic acid synthetase, mitochondrial precursor (Lip-syn) (Lipoate synthase) [Scheffersomyces stipitis CBS 6054]|uniref:Lipoyl synthase, mitochondrial n=1 Tax=Scheffersomyces stipitis (strain ATCC 58785 / CBS 6054 / NBRC 10063 / NRRL Y-11545) TaxID=322104 RepID=LIPA_PICST|nr:Lipoic acid synthetase, mitochondrial precursor (Lip-syn) (Lipoate synthase) [Scheffersomyces stipitis CBS 6054]A3GGJ5.2 RecName: Full=Lipoyl synthase, mitochondrial; AltName: Full=Lipoate synthase; Short=LS; Short=Lip-syn; AltName: Full=Lipoic acid synthase; Flags: Precursor [Scheffersomyces stipitis CBS 6054]EAZ63945.2 Lipoic acid synthetase, mitochondrial precursor (Lip-syn) (Lipoate synthase) [Scheffersomyces stipitis CBS 6054]
MIALRVHNTRVVSRSLTVWTRPSPTLTLSRSLATESDALDKPKTRRRKTVFTDALNSGPSFDDFVSGKASEIMDPLEAARKDPNQRLPSWLKVPIPKGKSYHNVKKDVRELKLATVCEEAKCPNIGECWGGKKSEATATIMLLGDTCTRGCRFCSVKTNRNPAKPDPMEPENTAEAISRWGLGYVVLTTVDRDDLADGGAHHLAETVMKIKQKAPQILVEVLGGDFRGDLDMATVLAKSGLDVYAHNLETVEALTPFVRDRRATYRQSLSVLQRAKETKSSLVTKTSLMLGLGETDEQILQTLKDLREINCDVVTFGQYMRPTKRHMKVVEYVTPEKFDYWRDTALEMGFLYVASGPLVRSSYKAGEAFIENVIRKRRHNVGEAPRLAQEIQPKIFRE